MNRILAYAMSRYLGAGWDLRRKSENERSSKMRSSIRLLVAGTVVTLAVFTALPAPIAGAEKAVKKDVTFSKDVAPIFQEKCQSCHRPGTVAPMSLVSYAEVRPWARSIKQRV